MILCVPLMVLADIQRPIFTPKKLYHCTNALASNYFIWWATPFLLQFCTRYMSSSTYARASENFRGCLPQYPPKNLGQILAALAISGIFERFSPGQSGSEVGGPIYINSPTGPPTSEPLWPGENLSKMPEIARAVRIWPKFFGGYWGRHPRKFS